MKIKKQLVTKSRMWLLNNDEIQLVIESLESIKSWRRVVAGGRDGGVTLAVLSLLEGEYPCKRTEWR